MLTTFLHLRTLKLLENVQRNHRYVKNDRATCSIFKMVEIMLKFINENITSRILFLLFAGTFVWVLLMNSLGESKSLDQAKLAGPITVLNHQLDSQKQGIQGVVSSLSGNHMPTNEKLTGNSQTVSTKVWVFRGKINGTTSPQWSLEQAKKHPSLIGWVLSDAEGKFKVGLPTGEYTLFGEFDSYLYLNSFVGDGSYASVQVSPNKITDMQIVNTENSFH